MKNPRDAGAFRYCYGRRYRLRFRHSSHALSNVSRTRPMRRADICQPFCRCRSRPVRIRVVSLTPAAGVLSPVPGTDGSFGGLYRPRSGTPNITRTATLNQRKIPEFRAVLRPRRVCPNHEQSVVTSEGQDIWIGLFRSHRWRAKSRVRAAYPSARPRAWSGVMALRNLDRRTWKQ